MFSWIQEVWYGIRLLFSKKSRDTVRDSLVPPVGFEGAVQQFCNMIQTMRSSDKDYLMGQRTPHLFASTLHHNLGRTVRNQWGLWAEDSELRDHMKKRFGVDHPDDISSMVMMCSWQKLNGKPMTPSIFAEACVEYWKTIEESDKGVRIYTDQSGEVKVEPID